MSILLSAFSPLPYPEFYLGFESVHSYPCSSNFLMDFSLPKPSSDFCGGTEKNGEHFISAGFERRGRTPLSTSRYHWCSLLVTLPGGGGRDRHPLTHLVRTLKSLLCRRQRRRQVHIYIPPSGPRYYVTSGATSLGTRMQCRYDKNGRNIRRSSSKYHGRGKRHEEGVRTERWGSHNAVGDIKITVNRGGRTVI